MCLLIEIKHVTLKGVSMVWVILTITIKCTMSMREVIDEKIALAAESSVCLQPGNARSNWSSISFGFACSLT